MASAEHTPLLSSDAPAGEKPTVYFLERHDSVASRGRPASSRSVVSSTRSVVSNQDAAEIDTIPEGSSVASFQPRPVAADASRTSVASPAVVAAAATGTWSRFFHNVGQKSHAFAGHPGGGGPGAFAARAAPVKIDPKVFFANERTFLAWTHVAVVLAAGSVAIAALTEAEAAEPGAGDVSVPDQLYGVVLLPVSIAFILYAMTQYSRRASMIRRKSPGPYADIAGPTVLTVMLMLSIVAQFSLKLYTLV